MLTCNICLEKIEKDVNCSITECRHKFHTSCLMKWSSINSTCPVCRFKLFETEERQERIIYNDPIDRLLDSNLVSNNLINSFLDTRLQSNNLIESGLNLLERVGNRNVSDEQS